MTQAKVTYLFTLLFLVNGLASDLMGGTKVSNSGVVGMVLLEEPEAFELSVFLEGLKSEWSIEVSNYEEDDKAAAFEIDGFNCSIVLFPFKIPGDEVESAAKLNPYWDEAVEEAARHKGHIVIAISNADEKSVEANLLFCKLAATAMNHSKAIGIYLGGRSLVLDKKSYLFNVQGMSKGDLPIYNWIYFGFRSSEGKQSIYTYGLSEFGYLEIEILDSQHSFTDLDDRLYDIVHYVLAYGVHLKHGETIGSTADEKLDITISEGRYVEGKTLKIDY